MTPRAPSSLSPSNQAAASAMVRAESAGSVVSATVTARASGRSRVPLQSGQPVSRM